MLPPTINRPRASHVCQWLSNDASQETGTKQSFKRNVHEDSATLFIGDTHVHAHWIKSNFSISAIQGKEAKNIVNMWACHTPRLSYCYFIMNSYLHSNDNNVCSCLTVQHLPTGEALTTFVHLLYYLWMHAPPLVCHQSAVGTITIIIIFKWYTINYRDKVRFFCFNNT